MKDAASAAIYGSRGSNGVILVTTKRGKTGKPVITLNAYAAFSSLERKVDVMDSNEWITFNKNGMTDNGSIQQDNRPQPVKLTESPMHKR